MDHRRGLLLSLMFAISLTFGHAQFFPEDDPEKILLSDVPLEQLLNPPQKIHLNFMDDLPLAQHDDGLDTAIEKISPECKATLLKCSKMSPESENAFEKGYYCPVIKNKYFKACMVNYGACSNEEYDNTYVAVCDNTPPEGGDDDDKLKGALKEVSETCNTQFSTCIKQSADVEKAINAGIYCPIVKLDFLRNCLVTLGTCQQEEYNSIYEKVCGEKAPEVPDNDKDDKLNQAIDKVSSECNQTIWSCIEKTPGIANVIKAKYYCPVLGNQDLKPCFVEYGECSEDEYGVMYETVCDKPRPTVSPDDDKIQIAVKKVSKECSGSLWECVNKNPSTITAFKAKYYCPVVENQLFRQCMVDFGECQQGEYGSIYETVCDKPAPTPPPEKEDKLKAVLDTVSKGCNDSVWDCVSKSDDALKAFKAKVFCPVIGNDAARECFVDYGKCKKAEYDSIKEAVCRKDGNSEGVHSEVTEGKVDIPPFNIPL